MKYNIPEKALNDIIFFSQKHGIEKVVLFGSRARGNHTDKSDIDIAVSGGDASDLYLDLEEYAHTLLMFDVVDLDERISEELRQEIEKDGIVIYEKV